MARSAQTGSRVRERRLMLGLKQAELAASVQISPSYLNLIEHNRRRIGGRLLQDLAQVLDVEPQVLAEGADAPLRAALHAISRDHRSVEIDQMDDFATRFPGWAHALSDQHRRIAELEHTVDGLNDRLTHDPVLSEAMHDVLSTVSAIRSTASILVSTPELDATWQERFHGNLDTESRRLADTSAAMAKHFDALTEGDKVFMTPLETAQMVFERNDHHFPTLEAPGPEGPDRAALDAVIAAADVTDPSAIPLLRGLLEDYAADAAQIPLARLEAALGDQPVLDPAALAARFGVDLGRMLLRLGRLPADPSRADMGLVRCDLSGAVLQRRAVPGFALPQYGAACPLWPLYQAMARPGHPIRARLETAEGRRFTGFAYAAPEGGLGFAGGGPLVSTMLIMEGADHEGGEVLAVGSTCRVCARDACTARREPSILRVMG